MDERSESRNPVTLLDLIRQRVERATKGPWSVYAGLLRPQFAAQIIEVQQSSGKPVVAWSGFDGLDMSSKQKMANADFIAHSREDIPALLRLATTVDEYYNRITDEEARLAIGYALAPLTEEAVEKP